MLHDTNYNLDFVFFFGGAVNVFTGSLEDEIFGTGEGTFALVSEDGISIPDLSEAAAAAAISLFFWGLKVIGIVLGPCDFPSINSTESLLLSHRA